MARVSHRTTTVAFLVTAAAVLAELLRRSMADGPIGPSSGRAPER
jgi:hypothetical protein